ncbi:MAG: hypothetical protein C0501_13410 [Isosphaera sp.]|nr:hypothetical protein [Isosphaera sp.]
MPRKFALGLGLAGALAGPAAAQFAADRPPAPPTAPVSPSTPPLLPPGVRPAGQAPTGFNAIEPPDGRPAAPPPVDLEIRSALGPDHPWAVKPEHGAFFICVKSYSRPSRPTAEDNGPSARTLAEELAQDIRDKYRVQAFLYEYISEERKAEMAAVAAARERARVFAGQTPKYKEETILKGAEWLPPDNRVRYKTVNYRDQIAVLVGGFESDKAAREALAKVRTWPAPANKNLMDGVAIGRTGRDGKQEVATDHLNPYLTAHVVPNPAVARPAAPAAGAAFDDFLVTLNEGKRYNLLKATKGWTLAVKSFTSPVQIVSRDSDGKGGGGLMRTFGVDKEKDALRAGAEQAEKLAEALRGMTDPAGRPLNLESFVLHTRTASLVTVGQFDGPHDPALVSTKRLLSSITPRVSEDKSGQRPVANAPTLFGNLTPIPIPRAAK